MNGEPKAGTGAPPSGGGDRTRGQIVELLLLDGVLAESQLRHAERVQARLAAPKPLVPLLLDLGLLQREGLQSTLQRHRLELRIGALLVELGHLSEAAVEQALGIQRETEDSGRKLGEILVTLGILGTQELAEVLSFQLGVACLTAAELEPDPALLERVPLDVCRRHRFLPVREDGTRVQVAFADPFDKDDAAAAQSFLGAEIVPRIVATNALDGVLSRLELGARVTVDADAGERAAARVLDELIATALRDAVSHVHVEPSAERVRIRLRRDGVLLPWRDLPPTLARPLLKRIAREAGLAAEEGEAQRNGTLRLESGGHSIALHAAFLSTGGAESVTLALSPDRARSLALGELGLQPAMGRRLAEGPLAAPGSLLLVAGPPGSGRRTTLRACATLLAEPSARVVVLAGLEVARGDGGALDPARLEAALLQDPDVLVLGVLHQPSELEGALRAARAGVRVLAALEVEDAVAGLFVAAHAARVRGLLLPALTAVLAQRLVRRVCDACAKAESPSAATLRRIGSTPVDMAGGAFRRGQGCGHCKDLGAAGRIGVFELHVLDEEGRDHVLAGSDAASIRRAAAQLGPATILEDGLLKAARGIVAVEELVRGVPRSAKPRSLAELARAVGEDW